MTHCTPEVRDAVRSAQRALVDRDCIAHATVFDPQHGPRDQWTLEAIVANGKHIPREVVAELAAAGLDVCLPVQRQGEHALLVATVVN